MATSALQTSCAASRRWRQCILVLSIRHHRNTRIKKYDIPPDKVKPLPISPHLKPIKDETIVIPPKIPREPTSILRALAATVKTDPTAAHYMYMDDPYMIPSDNFSRRNYALSKASGRKAARFMINKYPRYIENITVSHPAIPSLSPANLDYVTTEPCEVALVERIETRKVDDAIAIYTAMKHNGDVPSQTTHLRLLDLLCVYNSMDPPPALESEEFWFRKDMAQGEFTKRNNWQLAGAAERVFEDLNDKTPAAYNTLMRGFAHYKAVDKAQELYRFAKDNAIPVEVGTYTKLLPVCHTLLDTYGEKMNAIRDMLHDYRGEGHPPTLRIFNAAFAALSDLSRSRLAPEFCLRLLAEMKLCRIEPSLGTWHFVLRCFYSNPNSHGGILYEIMDELEGKGPTLQHVADVEFFHTAMTRCCHNLRDVSLAERIDVLLNEGDVNQLLSNDHLKSAYYGAFFRLVCSVDTWDKIIDLYNRIVPHIFVPHPNELMEFLSVMDLNGKHDLIPAIFTDLVIFGMYKHGQLIAHLFNIMAKKPHSPEIQEKFGEVVRQLKTLYISDENGTTRVKLKFEGGLLGDLILLSCRISDIELAWYFMTLYSKHIKAYRQFPSEQSLLALVDLSIEKRDKEKSLMFETGGVNGRRLIVCPDSVCLSLMADLSLPKVSDVAELISTSFELDNNDRAKVASIVRG